MGLGQNNNKQFGPSENKKQFGPSENKKQFGPSENKKQFGPSGNKASSRRLAGGELRSVTCVKSRGSDGGS